MWGCPRCGRAFSRPNQRHACGTGNVAEVLRNRPATLVALFRQIESFARSLGPIEIVARNRYVLLRTTRIFADMVIMSDAVRIALHLARRVDHPIFFKVGSDRKRVTHVAKLRSSDDLGVIAPLLREAYNLSLGGE